MRKDSRDAAGGGVGELVNDFGKLKPARRPAMDEQERDRFGLRGLDVDEVDREVFDVGSEVREPEAAGAQTTLEPTVRLLSAKFPRV
jgi:hypothetical protein